MIGSPGVSDAAPVRALGAEIIDSIELPIMVVGCDCTVASFNRAAATFFSLGPLDVGRSLCEIPLVSRVKRLEELCGDAIARGMSSQGEVRDATGSWFVLRIAPYRGSDQQIAGAVLTLTNVTAFRESLEQAVHEREHTKAIINTVIDPLVVLDEDLQIQTANQAFYKMFQVSREETRGVRLFELGNTDWAARLQTLLKGNHSTNGHFDSIEIEHELPTIGRRTLLLNARRLSRPANPGQMTLVSIQDITERRCAEEALRESEERYRTLFDLGPVAIYSIDTSGVIQHFNRRAAELWGRAPASGDTDERFCGSFKLFRPDGSFMPHEQCPMAEVVSGKISEVHDTEALIERPDGSRVTVVVNIAPLKNERGEIAGAVNCFYDITERKQAEEARARLSAIVESSDDAIISKDLSGIIASWNEGAKRLFGYTAQEAIGQPVTMLIPPDRLNEEPGILERIRHGARVEHYETVRRRKDGTLFDVSLTVSPLMDRQGKVVGASKIARDITERKRAGEKLEQTVVERTAALQAANEQLEAFIYSIAHDLRAPLRSMTAYSQLLVDDHAAELNDAAKRMLKRIQASSEFMDRLLVDLLAYGRTGRVEFELGAVEVQKAWEAARFQSEPQIEQAQGHVETIGPLPRVRAHEATLGQVLANLLSNALKFVAPGVQPRIRFRAEERGNCVRLWVEDNGVGIPAEHHERVFRVFERLHGASYPGTGIGLSIVRKGVERMGGKVGLESELGKGTRFWIELAKAG